MIRFAMLSAIAAAALATPALAAPGDNLRQTVALRSLETVTRISPSDGGAYIELAQGYLRSGRTADATAAYTRALQLDNVMLVTATGGSVWSHQIARDALAKLPRTPQLSSR